jgi:actin-related protein 5
MAPSAIDTPMQDAEPENKAPPPRLYPPREAHFEKSIEPRPDGYQKAKSRGSDRVAIVIDNGTAIPSLSRHQEHIY